MKLKIEQPFQKMYSTHNFDFSSPLISERFKDYECKNCGCILRQTLNEMYYIAGPTFESRYDKRYMYDTCDQILMQVVLE